MILPPPRSTLFPYTTLFRTLKTFGFSRSSYHPVLFWTAVNYDLSSVHTKQRNRTRRSLERSEEHTSELQSLRHLVCRLLLEKKKQKQMHHVITIMERVQFSQ